jgi:hypothetical protein
MTFVIIIKQFVIHVKDFLLPAAVTPNDPLRERTMVPLYALNSICVYKNCKPIKLLPWRVQLNVSFFLKVASFISC